MAESRGADRERTESVYRKPRDGKIFEKGSVCSCVMLSKAIEKVHITFSNEEVIGNLGKWASME